MTLTSRCSLLCSSVSHPLQVFLVMQTMALVNGTSCDIAIFRVSTADLFVVQQLLFGCDWIVSSECCVSLSTC